MARRWKRARNMLAAAARIEGYWVDDCFHADFNRDMNFIVCGGPQGYLITWVSGIEEVMNGFSGARMGRVLTARFHNEMEAKANGA